MTTIDLPTPTTSTVDADFFRWEEDQGAGVRPVRGRTAIHRVDAFQTIHTASYEKVRELVPSAELHPARWFDGRGLVFVAAMRYRDVTTRDDAGATVLLPPYAEVVVGVLLATDPEIRGLAPYGQPLRGFVLHMPVTTAVAAESGRSAYGFPSFVADLAFHDSPTRRCVTVTEGGHGILVLHTALHGHVHPDHAPVIMYSELDGRLVETMGRFFGHRQTMLRGGSGDLALPGLHPVAERLRELETDAAALVTVNHVDARLIFGPPVDVGAAHPYAGFVPADEPRFGRYTVDYPDTPPLDQYSLPLDARTVAAPSPVG